MTLQWLTPMPHEVLERYPALHKTLMKGGGVTGVSCQELVEWKSLKGALSFNSTKLTGRGGVSWNAVLKLFLIVSNKIYY